MAQPLDESGSSDTVDPSEIEDEDKEGDSSTVKPWDPTNIRITTKTYTLREIFNQITDQDLDLAPDFQRAFVWREFQQARLVESILLGIPLPAFYFNEDKTGAHQVIDGVQRLTTIKLFMSDELKLGEQHLEYLANNLRGRTYSTLDPVTRRRFAGTQIVAHVIEPQTPDEVKYDIFNRVNTGGSPLTAQEIRHCMSKSRSREFLRTLVESNEFDLATGGAFWTKDSQGKRVRDNHRMADREMALRFCAFKSTSIEEYIKASSLDAFLLEFTRRLDGNSQSSSPALNFADLKTSFDRAMRNCHLVLGNGSFRRWPPDAPRRGPMNRAIFESQALALADIDPGLIEDHSDEIRQALRELFDDADYDNAVRFGTGDPRKVDMRLRLPKDAIEAVLS